MGLLHTKGRPSTGRPLVFAKKNHHTAEASSERQLQRSLHDARLHRADAGDVTKRVRARSNVVIRRPKTRMIERVERLQPELQIPCIADRPVLARAQIGRHYGRARQLVLA